MSFKIDKEKPTKNITTETIESKDPQDDFIIRRDPFHSNPDSLKQPDDIGEEFLIDQEDVEEDQEQKFDEDTVSLQSNDPFIERDEVGPEAQPEVSYEEIQKQKSHYLYQLRRLQNKGFETRRLGMSHSLEEIRGEVFRVKKEIDMDSGIDFARQGLMFCVSTIEMLNGRYKFGANLNGWSQAVMGNIESYDEVFEELYDKYYSSVKMAPEIKLMAMLGGSAFMFHLQKSLINNDGGIAPRQREMKGPSIDTDDLLRQLNEEVDDDNLSLSSKSSSKSSASVRIVHEEPSQTKNINVKTTKRRGRPPKKN